MFVKLLRYTVQGGRVKRGLSLVGVGGFGEFYGEEGHDTVTRRKREIILYRLQGTGIRKITLTEGG